MSILVAVYGSLRKTQGNHRLLDGEGVSFIKTATIEGYDLFPYAGISFPCIAKGENKVVVEIYSVDPTTFKRLDGLEGYPSFYNREQVQVEGLDDQPWIYYHEQPPSRMKPIKHGDWLRYKKEIISDADIS